MRWADFEVACSLARCFARRIAGGGDLRTACMSCLLAMVLCWVLRGGDREVFWMRMSCIFIGFGGTWVGCGCGGSLMVKTGGSLAFDGTDIDSALRWTRAGLDHSRIIFWVSLV